jgi:hypothetical protein
VKVLSASSLSSGGGQESAAISETKRQFLNDKVRLCLQKLAEQFVSHAFDEMMAAVFVGLDKEKVASVAGDYLHYYYLCGFFLEFNRSSSQEQIKDMRSVMSLDFSRTLVKNLKVCLIVVFIAHELAGVFRKEERFKFGCLHVLFERTGNFILL